MKKNPKNPGSLGGEMRMRINNHCKNLSNHTRSNYLHACKAFDTWRKSVGLSNKYIREHPRESVVQWAEYLEISGISQSTIHTMVAGCCCGLGIPSGKICKHGNAMQKSKSLGNSERSRAAMERESNQEIIRFQKMVGGRRNGLARLTGKCFVYDESNMPCIFFERDKGGKSHKQRLLPEHVEEVKAYFDSVGPNECLFAKLDKDLDLHGLRAEHARQMYQYYVNIASTAQGREHLRQQLWARYKDPEIGCKAWLIAQAKGDRARMKKLEYRFGREMADGTYHLRGANRQAALERGRATKYDRLAILATSTFALSHWRCDTCVKFYML